MKSGIDARLKREITETILKYVPRDNSVVFLFGSLAQDEVYPSSDIDIGIICNRALPNSLLVKIKDELEKARTLRQIDIVDFSSQRSKDFLKAALKKIEIWHQTKKSGVYLDNLKRRISD